MSFTRIQHESYVWLNLRHIWWCKGLPLVLSTECGFHGKSRFCLNGSPTSRSTSSFRISDKQFLSDISFIHYSVENQTNLPWRMLFILLLHILFKNCVHKLLYIIGDMIVPHVQYSQCLKCKTQSKRSDVRLIYITAFFWRPYNR